jgi:protease I
MGNLSDRKVAILTEEGFEQVELTSPKRLLKQLVPKWM